jgi:hypothetical protein
LAFIGPTVSAVPTGESLIIRIPTLEVKISAKMSFLFNNSKRLYINYFMKTIYDSY